MIQEYTGKTPFFTDRVEAASRLILAVVCFVEDLSQEVYALFDTASEWSILPPTIAARIGFDLENGADTILSTRYGLIHGRLERLLMRFDAHEGQALEREMTFFLSAEWPGPAVIGWRGGLEHMQFGFNTTEEVFLFAP